MTAGLGEVRSEPGAENDGLRQLLLSYRVVMLRAQRLPWILWMRTRPVGSSPLARWWALPRLTWGTSLFVLYHVYRSTQALSRAYASRAAVGDLDAQGQRERQMVADFRESLRPISWRWLVIAAAVAALLVGRTVVNWIAEVFGVLVVGFRNEPWEVSEDQRKAMREVFDGLASAAASLSVPSLSAVTDQLGEADVTGLIVLALGLLAAAYIVLRPASTAFRVKRVLFNLADEPESTLRRTTSTWHVPRTTGLYQRERQFFEAAGVPGGVREKPLDLALSLLATLLVGWGVTSFLLIPDPSIPRIEVIIVTTLVVMPFISARLIWLARTYLSRRRYPGDWLSTGALLPATSRTVDTRQAAEAAALAALGGLFLLILWYRLARQMADLREEVREQSFVRTKRLPRWVLPLTAALASVLLWPVMLIFRAWLAAQLTPRAYRNPALWAATLGSTMAIASWIVIAAAAPSEEWSATTLAASLAVSITFPLAAIVFAALQALQNGIVRRMADPLPFDVVPTGAELAPREFNPPIGWPVPPPDWQPAPGWQPDPRWISPPEGWRTWTRTPPQGTTG